jgi:signal transduction histidine kinase
VAFGDRPLLILFIFPIILSAYVGGLGPGLLSTFLAAAIVDYFLIPPTGSFIITQAHDLVQWLMLILNGAIISLLTEALHRFRASAEKRTDDFIRTNRALEEEISERNRADAALQEKNRELERFTYMISHDLKSPLVTIKTFLGYIQKDFAAAKTEHMDNDLQYIDNAADRMGQLLDDLLEFSRIGRVSAPPGEIGFQELVGDALKLTAGAIDARGVEVSVTAADIALFGDRTRLLEIWQNLLENAVKYMGPQESPRIEIGIDGSGRETSFYVRDNGMGFDPRNIEKIFGIFVKLDQASEGTGLGLALVKRIVELYGGIIRAESEGPGQGASFRFTLPEAVRPHVEGP